MGACVFVCLRWRDGPASRRGGKRRVSAHCHDFAAGVNRALHAGRFAGVTPLSRHIFLETLPRDAQPRVLNRFTRLGKMLMKAVHWNGQRLELNTAYPTPKADAQTALVRVHLAGICSTDLQIFQSY